MEPAKGNRDRDKKHRPKPSSPLVQTQVGRGPLGTEGVMQRSVEELNPLQSQASPVGIGRCRLYLLDPEELADSRGVFSLGSWSPIRRNSSQMWICQVERQGCPSAKQNLKQGSAWWSRALLSRWKQILISCP